MWLVESIEYSANGDQQVMADTTTARFIRGSGITVLGSLFIAALQFISVIVLARLLDPADFGLIAMVGVFLALGSLLKDFGLPMAALQIKDLSAQQASNIFWLNAALASIVGFVLTVSAPAIAALYSEPRLTSIIPLMTLAILAHGFGAQLQVQLSRSMRYRALVVTEVLATGIGIGTAWYLAFSGWGYWALVTQNIVAAVSLLLLRWGATRWAPMRYRRGYGTLSMLRSGMQYGLAQCLTFLQNNAATLIIGVQLGVAPLGIYNRADQLLAAPASKIVSPLTQVIVPTVNRMRKDEQSYLTFLLKVQFILAFALLWIFALVAGTAEVLIPLMLGPGWGDAVIIIQILSIGCSFTVLSTVSYWGFIVNQLSKQLFYYNLATKPMSIVFVLVGSLFGLPGAAGGVALGLFVSWPINLIWLSRTAQFPGWSFFKNGLLVFCCAGLTSLSTWAVAQVSLFSSELVKLLLAVAVGSFVYITSLCLIKHTRSNLIGSVSIARKMMKQTRLSEGKPNGA